jgi:hypothetical protein
MFKSCTEKIILQSNRKMAGPQPTIGSHSCTNIGKAKTFCEIRSHQPISHIVNGMNSWYYFKIIPHYKIIFKNIHKMLFFNPEEFAKQQLERFTILEVACVCTQEAQREYSPQKTNGEAISNLWDKCLARRLMRKRMSDKLLEGQREKHAEKLVHLLKDANYKLDLEEVIDKQQNGLLIQKFQNKNLVCHNVFTKSCD